MRDSESISVWISSLKRGSDDAAQKIWQRYYSDLVAQAHRKLGDRTRRTADEEDVVQDAFASFFQSVRYGRFPELQDREDLWAILFVLVDRRSMDRLREEMAAKRGGGQVRGDSALIAPSDRSGGGNGFDLIMDRKVTPESLNDLIAVLKLSFKTLEDDVLCSIAIAKLQGFKNVEIAQRQTMSLRAVERKLQLVRRMLNEEISYPPE